jgi:hypothetical protein
VSFFQARYGTLRGAGGLARCRINVCGITGYR